MAEYRVTESINFENKDIIWRNFSGKAGKFNAEGQRSFNVILNEDEYLTLQADGWNVRVIMPKPDQDPDTPPLYILPVKVAFGKRPPVIQVIGNGRRQALTEETVNMLDWTEIKPAGCDITVNPYNYDVMGKQGVSAYLKAMYVNIVEDHFAAKYADVPTSAMDALMGE
jgi:hypothetical protein